MDTVINAMSMKVSPSSGALKIGYPEDASIESYHFKTPGFFLKVMEMRFPRWGPLMMSWPSAAKSTQLLHSRSAGWSGISCRHLHIWCTASDNRTDQLPPMSTASTPDVPEHLQGSHGQQRHQPVHMGAPFPREILQTFPPPPDIPKS